MTANPSPTAAPTETTATQTFLEELMLFRPAVQPAVTWLIAHGFDPNATLAAVAGRLKKRQRHLPPNLRCRYYEVVLLNEFVSHWVRHNRGAKVKDWIEDGVVKDADKIEEELKPFQTVTMLICDENAFTKHVNKLFREAEARRCNLEYGTGIGFDGYVVTNTLTLANRLLVNFNPNLPNATRGATRYLIKTALSCYLKHRTTEPNYASTGMLKYLQTTKAKRRHVVAYKLVNCPMDLTLKERFWLREKYGWTRLNGRMMVKSVADLMGYKNPQALSRQLNKMRGWAKDDVMLDAIEREGGAS